jgi:glutamate synthase domain-containing protein 2
MHGFSTLRKVPSFDDLVFLPATLTRFPLEGYKEKCETETVLGTRSGAKRPLRLSTPLMITGMSFGALSVNAKVALGRAATEMGISTATGDGGMLPEEREASKTLIYQVLASRYGQVLEQMQQADALEIVVGQGAKPGTGGLLLGMKISERVSRMRTLPVGVDQRGPARHPDWLAAPDLAIKIEELREATNYEIPIIIKMGASRVKDDVKIACKIGADIITVDGMEGGTGASPDFMLDHTGIPTLGAVVESREALEEVGMFSTVHLIISGGIRSGTDAAKALALGADAVAIGSAALIALNCNRAIYVEDYAALGTKPGFCHHCHTGECPVGITTQLPHLVERLPVDEAAERVLNMLNAFNYEMTMLAKSCGKGNIHSLDPEDLRALTVEAAAMARIPLAGTDWIPGKVGG